MALSMMLCLNSAQTEINRCCFCKVVWQRYLGEVGKFYRTLWLIYPRHCVNFYQNQSSIVEVMIKKNLVCPTVYDTQHWCCPKCYIKSTQTFTTIHYTDYQHLLRAKIPVTTFSLIDTVNQGGTG